MELRGLFAVTLLLCLVQAGKKRDRSLKVRHREGRDEPDNNEGTCELQINCKVSVINV